MEQVTEASCEPQAAVLCSAVPALEDDDGDKEAGGPQDGPGLHPAVAARVVAALETAPRFADPRLREEAPADLAQEPFQIVPPVSRALAWAVPDTVSATPLLAARLARGPLGLQECVGARWSDLEQAISRFAADLRAKLQGQQFAHRRVFQLQCGDLPDFAREAVEAGVVLEFLSSGPKHAGILQPSTEADIQGGDVFPGKRIDVESWRQVAAESGSTDFDIQAQSRSGVQSRAKPARAITIFFPHSGLLEHIQAARPKVDAEIEQGWTLAPVPHLPFIPMIVNPRDCIMQSKVKEGEDGELFAYDSPRVTTDMSAGGDDAPNEGIEDAEATLRLPTVQQGCRDGAIIDEILGGQEFQHPETAHVRVVVSHPPAGKRRTGLHGDTLFVVIDRSTVLGNMFRMGPQGRDERLRDAVCDAHEEVVRQPKGANFQQIAQRHGIKESFVDRRWLGKGARRALMHAIVELVEAAREGLHIHMQCGTGCRGRRCHGHTYQKLLRSAALLVGLESGQADLSSAYYFCCTQRLDWPRQCFLWPDWVSAESWEWNFLGFAIATRLVFGGRHGPNRFDRIGGPPLCLARDLIQEFEAAHPPAEPRLAQRWQEWKAERPEGKWQRMGCSVKKFIDDLELKALNDRVPIPAQVRHIRIPADLTVAFGFIPSHPNSRAAVYLRLLIHCFARCGFEVTKIQCGSGGVDLGLQITMPRGEWVPGGINVPAVKCWTMLRSIDAMQEALHNFAPIRRSEVESLTGRLAYISQVEPTLVPALRGGYAVAHARERGAPQGRRALLRVVRVKVTTTAGAAFGELLRLARTVLYENVGVPLAAARRFRGPSDPDVCVITTDASGIHGLGGFAFHPSRPNSVWLLSDWWTPDILMALRVAAEARAATPVPAGVPALSMPAAELFGAWAMGAAMQEVLPHLSAIIAVGDCQPACAAINKASSPVAQLNALVQAARRSCAQWLAVHVPRRLNVGADSLSHPREFERLQRELEDMGWAVHRVHVPTPCWHALSQAARLGTGNLRFTEGE